MPDSLFPALVISALAIGGLHTLAPDHWVPFAALARARGWTSGQTSRLIALWGTGHVGVSVALGLLAIRGPRWMVSYADAAAGVAIVAIGVVVGMAGW